MLWDDIDIIKRTNDRDHMHTSSIMYHRIVLNTEHNRTTQYSRTLSPTSRCCTLFVCLVFVAASHEYFPVKDVRHGIIDAIWCRYVWISTRRVNIATLLNNTSHQHCITHHRDIHNAEHNRTAQHSRTLSPTVSGCTLFLRLMLVAAFHEHLPGRGARHEMVDVIWRRRLQYAFERAASTLEPLEFNHRERPLKEMTLERERERERGREQTK